MIKDYLSENIHKITEKKNFSFIPYFQKLFKLQYLQQKVGYF